MEKLGRFLGAFLSVILFMGIYSIAEEITLTTYYPAPYGAYEELTVTGNVGIGTTSPVDKFDVRGQINIGGSSYGVQSGTSGLGITFPAPANDWLKIIGEHDGGDSSYIILSTSDNPNDGIKFRNFDQATGLTQDWFYSDTTKTCINTGSVGIGTTDPGTYKLDVRGNTIVDRIYTRQATTAHGQGHNFNDIAEDIMAEGCEAGDVVVIDPINKEKVIKSTKPYDTSVAGIISETPAFYIGKRDQKPYLPLALAGRILCKVSLENGPIKQGDLLTSSVTPGHAMKATNRKKIHGAIVAKALDIFEGGPNGEKTGKIMVLVTLQ